MRWYWADRFTEFIAGQRAVAVKNISLAEEHLHDHYDGFPIMPHSLIVEGCALTGGLLASQQRDYRERVVLAKVSKATFHDLAYPGDQLTYTATLEDVHNDGAAVVCQVHNGERLQAELQLFFAHVPQDVVGVETMFEPYDMLNLLRIFGILDVIRTPEGEPVPPPPHLVAAEAALHDHSDG